MASIPELLKNHVTLEVECLDRLYLNGYIGALATPGGLVNFMRVQLEKPVPSPAVLGQISEKFREAVKAMAEEHEIPIHQFDHKERKDDVANAFRKKRGVRDQIVFAGVAFKAPEELFVKFTALPKFCRLAQLPRPSALLMSVDLR